MLEEQTQVIPRKTIVEGDRAFPESFRNALEYMRDRAFMGTSVYRGQQYEAGNKGVDPALWEWSRALVRRFQKLDIPVYVTRFDGNAAYVAHGVHGDQLPGLCKELIRTVALEVASTSGTKNLEWAGESDPLRFFLSEPSGKLPELDRSDALAVSKAAYGLD